MQVMLMVMSVALGGMAPTVPMFVETLAPPKLGGGGHHALVKPDRRVRTSHPRVAAALFAGVSRSRTFAALIDALDRSNVIAYVELVQELPRAARGRLILATKIKEQRYVRIQLRFLLGHDEMISVLGHELQHALEIAQAPEVTDNARMRKFYQRTGAGMSDGFGFDTAAARIAGDQVRRELKAAS